MKTKLIKKNKATPKGKSNKKEGSKGSIIADIDINSIRIGDKYDKYDCRTATKVKEGDAIVATLKDAIEAGSIIPLPVLTPIIFEAKLRNKDGSRPEGYAPIDGRRRILAYKASGHKTVKAILQTGLTEYEKHYLSLKLNSAHGTPLTRGERKIAVGSVITQAKMDGIEIAQMQIAKDFGVNQSTISRAIESMKKEGSLPKEFRTTAHSKGGRPASKKTSGKPVTASVNKDADAEVESGKTSDKGRDDITGILSFAQLYALIGQLRNVLEAHQDRFREELQAFKGKEYGKRSETIQAVCDVLESLI